VELNLKGEGGLCIPPSKKARLGKDEELMPGKHREIRRKHKPTKEQ
jgi:hypothetical protein